MKKSNQSEKSRFRPYKRCQTIYNNSKFLIAKRMTILYNESGFLNMTTEWIYSTPEHLPGGKGGSPGENIFPRSNGCNHLPE
jgi:hypothetical protein